MITIHGTRRREGIAIAVAAVVDLRAGPSAVSPTLLQSGLDALKRGLPPQDYPEAVIVCENLAVGAAANIPGVQAVGIAAQDDADAPGAEYAVPCVAGLCELLKSVREDDIVIVDGDKGIAHIDPDPSTLTHYQHIEEQRSAREPVFIASQHIPAKTQAGETVLVYAYVRNDCELSNALEEGADGVLMDVRGCETRSEDDFARLLISCAGKRVSLIAEYLPRDALSAMARTQSNQVIGVVFPVDGFAERVREAGESLEAAATEAFLRDLDPPRVAFGVFGRDVDFGTEFGLKEAAVLALDFRESACIEEPDADLRGRMRAWPTGRRPEDTVVVLGRRLQAIGTVVAAGARAIAVEPEMVGAAKYAIRCIGPEEDE